MKRVVRRRMVPATEEQGRSRHSSVVRSPFGLAIIYIRDEKLGVLQVVDAVVVI